jgi:signal transduction histidine kinase/ligand-binding sensor domain-containing protein
VTEGDPGFEMIRAAVAKEVGVGNPAEETSRRPNRIPKSYPRFISVLSHGPRPKSSAPSAGFRRRWRPRTAVGLVPMEEVLHHGAMRHNGSPRTRRGGRVWRTGKLLCVLTWLGAGLVPRSSAANYFINVWRHDDGLPQNAVSGVVQTRDGYLWIGTYSGLARFDGERFVVFDNNNTPEMYSSRVTSLYEDPQGNLWIGFETGGLTRYRDRTFNTVDMPAEWGGRRIIAIGKDGAGDLWMLGVDGSLLRLRDRLLLKPATAGATAELGSLVTEHDGKTWVLWNGTVSLLASNRMIPAPFTVNTPSGFVQGIAASRSGGIWVATDGRVRKWWHDQWTNDLGASPWGVGESTSAFIERRDGSLAAGVVDRGLDLISPAGEVSYVNRTNGLPSDWVRALCEDREGDLWIGTGNGLAVLKTGKVGTVNPPDHWQGRAVLSLGQAPNGVMWVGTEGAGLYRLENGDWSQFGTADGVSNLFVWSVSADPRGRIWAGTWGGGLVVQRDESFARPPGLENDTVPMLAVLHVGPDEAWIGTTAGLLHYLDGKVELFGKNRGLIYPDVRAIVRDNQGAVWFGMLGGGLGLLQNGTVRQFRKPNGLSNNFVQCLRLDPDGALWIGTFGGGLNRLKQGRFTAISTRQGLPNDVICDIQDDGYGNFWFSSHAGIFRASKEQLNRCADGLTNSVACVTFDKSDGLPTLECSGGFQPASCRSADGRLWFPTSAGLVVIDPSERNINHLPPPVVLEDLVVDGQSLPIGTPGAGPLRIGPGHNHFEFNFTGLSLVAPEKVKFKYRLEGQEVAWEDSGSKRFASYSFIPPGDYTFHVIACNNDGIWNPTGASVSFTVLPHFWQTWTFRITCGALVALAIGGVVRADTRRRMRRKLDRLERQRAVERERARIAKDIHDDLGASLTRITLLSQTTRGQLDNAAVATMNLDRIYGIARELTRALDEIVWAVNPQHDTLDSLANYLGRFAQDFLAAASISCRLDLSVQLPAWPLTAEVRHSLFLAFKEALHNVVKHASASEVRISLELQEEEFVLTIADNGRGFTPAATESDRPTRGNGLANMHRRLADIGGRCEIRSAPGSGAEIKFVVPARTRQLETG